MARVVRWLHLSDFHVGMDDYATRRLFAYIIEHARQKEIAPDLVFITGDLANRGLASEYETFWFEFAWPLQEALGCGSGDLTFVIPGNHDVDRQKHPAFDREEMCDSKSQYFDPTTEGNRLREMLIPRFKAFLDNDSTVTKGAFATDSGAYVRQIKVSGVDVAIVGVNTAWLCK